MNNASDIIMFDLVLDDYKNLDDSISRANTAFELEDYFKKYKTQASNCFLQMGKILKIVRDNHLYRELGYESIIDWFSSPDVSVTPSWAWAFISIYETFVIEYKFSEEDIADIDYTKLKDITTLIKENPEQAEEWLNKAKLLRRIDLRKEIRLHRLQQRDQKLLEAEKNISASIKKRIQILNGNRIDELKKIPNASVELVATSPPYIIPEGEKDYRQNNESYKIVSSYVDVVSYHREWLDEVKRILKPNGSVFIIGTLNNIFTIGHILQDMGFMIIRDIIWEKPNPPLKHNIFSLIKAHETVIWARKGSEHTNNIVEVERDIWPITVNEVSDYYTEKPNVLLDKLISMGSSTGSTVLDPFTGDGSVAVASFKLNRNYIGIEPDEEWLSFTKLRLENLK